MSPDDVAARRPVWSALSDFYLDTDVEGFYSPAAGVLAASGYTLDELLDILRHEVHPVLHRNLQSAAGEWAHFDADWLEQRILQRLAQPRWRRPFGCVLCRTPNAIWARLGPMVATERATRAVASA